MPSGKNFDKADFKFWMPSVTGADEGVLVLVPGSNNDGRSMADDAVWRAFATKHKLAIAACRFTDTPHDQSFIEHYVNASQGTGQALLDALASVSTSRAVH